MSDGLVFYTNPQSRGQIIRWLLEELGAPYETVILDYGTTMKAPDYLAINPMGKVPALRDRGSDGDVVVTESAAICAYLADRFPDKGLAPPPGSPAATELGRALAERVASNELSGDSSVTVGNLSPRRDFTDVRDVVRAYRLLVEHGTAGEVYNVCSGQAIAVQALAEKVAA